MRFCCSHRLQSDVQWQAALGWHYSLESNMIKRIITSTILTLAVASAAWAGPVMTKKQYEDYSVLYHCMEIKSFESLDAKNAEQLRIDKMFGLTDENYESFEALIAEYESDADLLERIRVRANKECH